MLDACSPAASGDARAVPQTAAVGTAVPLPVEPSALAPAMRQLEAQLGMLLTTFHDDAGFWPAFAGLMQELETGLVRAERARLRSHADFLLVRAGMPSWTLVGAAFGVPDRTAAPAPR